MQVMHFIRIIKAIFYDATYRTIVIITTKVKCFGQTQPKILVRRSCIIECQYKYLVPKQMIYDASFLRSYVISVFIVNFSIITLQIIEISILIMVSAS